MGEENKFELEHIQRGPAQNKIITSITLLSFAIQDMRDAVLKALADKLFWQDSKEIKLNTSEILWTCRLE